MDKRWSLVAVMGLFACSRAPEAPALAAVGRAELRQAAPLAATRFAGDLAGAAIRVVEAQRTALGLGAGDSFRVVKVEGANHVRLQQLHQGIKVWGAEVVVHGDDGRLDSIAGMLAASLGGLELTPALSQRDAVAAAKFDYADGAARGATLRFAEEARELVIVPLESGAAHLAWHVSFATDAQGGREPGRWHYFVDAHSGVVLQQFNSLHTLAQR